MSTIIFELAVIFVVCVSGITILKALEKMRHDILDSHHQIRADILGLAQIILDHTKPIREGVRNDDYSRQTKH